MSDELRQMFLVMVVRACNFLCASAEGWRSEMELRDTVVVSSLEVVFARTSLTVAPRIANPFFKKDFSAYLQSDFLALGRLGAGC